MNEIINAVIEQHNTESRQAVIQAGVRLAEEIKANRDKISGCQQRIKERQAELQLVSADVISETSIYGGSVPSNANRDTIVAVIEKANKDRQFGIEQRASNLKNAIVAEQDAIAALNKVIVGLQAEVNKLAPVAITAEQIVG